MLALTLAKILRIQVNQSKQRVRRRCFHATVKKQQTFLQANHHGISQSENFKATNPKT